MEPPSHIPSSVKPSPAPHCSEDLTCSRHRTRHTEDRTAPVDQATRGKIAVRSRFSPKSSCSRHTNPMMPASPPTRKWSSGVFTTAWPWGKSASSSHILEDPESPTQADIAGLPAATQPCISILFSRGRSVRSLKSGGVLRDLGRAQCPSRPLGRSPSENKFANSSHLPQLLAPRAWSPDGPTCLPQPRGAMAQSPRPRRA